MPPPPPKPSANTIAEAECLEGGGGGGAVCLCWSPSDVRCQVGRAEASVSRVASQCYKSLRETSQSGEALREAAGQVGEVSRGRAMEMDGREVQRKPEARSRIPGLTKGLRVIGSGLCSGQTLMSRGTSVATNLVEWAQAGVRGAELEVLALGTLGIMWPMKRPSVG